MRNESRIAASSSMTRIRAFTLVELQRVQRAARFGLEEIEREDVTGARARRQATEILDRPHRLAIDLEEDVAALDFRVERRAHRLDTRDDDPFRAGWQARAGGIVAIDLAHRETERRAPLARRLRLRATAPLRALVAKPALGQLHRHVHRSTVADDLQRRNRPGLA